MTRKALTGADIFDGAQLHRQKALLLEEGVVTGLVPEDQLPEGVEICPMSAGTVMPGFVDLQVNGGGGVMFNDVTSVDGIRVMAAAHGATGTQSLLPTLITDTDDRTRAAVDAVEAAIAADVPGVIGLHLEGPHLSLARKGAHDPNLIRPMTSEDAAFLCDAASRLPNLMVTVAPENVSLEQIAKLSDAGVIVSLGHSDCSVDEANAAFAAGARCVTHLFNAMSPLTSRAPGLVGAALNASQVAAGLIADDIHVHATAMRIALRAKGSVDGIFLVTDAMSTVGSDITEFHLNNRRVLRRDNRLTLEDGTLAGADLEMSRALSVMVHAVGLPPEAAFAMATRAPAAVLRHAGSVGRFVEGEPARAIHIDAALQHVRVL